MHFEERVQVRASESQVWDLLWDVQRLARCLPGCKEVREVQPRQKYAAVVEERVGPFKAQFTMNVDVVRMEPHKSVQLLATGGDSKLGASARGELALTLQDLAGQGTGLDIVADVQITGKIAALGQTVIKRKAQEMIGRFAKAVAAEIDSPVKGV